MATIDFDAISAAIANRYVPAQVTPPTGYGNVRFATSDIPNRLTNLPAVLVIPDRGTLEAGNGSRFSTCDWLVQFFFSIQKDLPREMLACKKWLGILIDQVRAGEVAGQTTPVQVIRVIGYRVGTLRWANRDYTGIELNVRATLMGPWS